VPKLRVQSFAISIDGYGAGPAGRNMFGPVRGPWPDDKGGTEFRFVNEGIHAAFCASGRNSTRRRQ
jgi:hypothetical protein